MGGIVPHRSRPSRAFLVRSIVGMLMLTLVAAACSSEGAPHRATSTSIQNTPESGTPVRGGSLTMGLEAESGGGYCLPDAQLAVSGWQVATSIYDTLAIINSEGKYVPFLAKTIEPNADSTVWTITLRSGIRFQDGTPLTADVVRNNFLAWLGRYPGRTSLLFQFVLNNVKDVTSDGNLTVTVTMKKPWSAFPWALYSQGRLGIMAQAQLDASPEDCKSRTLIGTGPFKFVSWTPNEKMVLERNPYYWRKDKNGVQLPYLDAITYVPVPDEQQRENGLAANDFQVIEQFAAVQTNDLKKGAAAGKYNIATQPGHREVSYDLLNARRAPFDDLSARQALAYATDTKTLNLILNGGAGEVALQPFDHDVIGYDAHVDYPKFDLTRAKEKVAEYKRAHGGTFPRITFLITDLAVSVKAARELVDEWGAAGISATITPVNQTKIIDQALRGDFDVLLIRNHPGGDPDSQYVWWWNTPSQGKASQPGNPVNFGAFADDAISNDLDTGRAQEVGSATRTATYQKLSNDFATSLWNNWLFYIRWMIGARNNVFGLTGGTLPDGSTPYPVIAGLIRADNLWIKQ